MVSFHSPTSSWSAQSVPVAGSTTMPSACACQSGCDGLKHGVHVEPPTVNEVGKLYDAVLWYETLPPPPSVSVNRARLMVFSCVANTSTVPAGFRHAATP